MSIPSLFTVAGKPILHSQSPLIFNPVFNRYSLDALYTRMAAADAEDAVFLYKDIGLSGMNVTAPLKEGVMRFLDEIDDEAERIGSVNVVVTEGKRLKGYNTDHLGVMMCFDRRNLVIEGKSCVVLGAGGAGRAAAYGLCSRGADVVMVNRTHGRAVEAAGALHCRAARIEQIASELDSADIFISAVSRGVDIVDASRLRSDLVVLDANYRNSPLSSIARERGCTVIGGAEWLINQAVPACKYFTGVEPDRSLIEETLFRGEPSKRKKCISLIGFSGSGKTLVGKMLAEKLGYGFLDMDDKIELAEKLSIPEIFNEKGEGYFRALEKALLEDMKSLENTVISCGGGAVLDAANRGILKGISTVFWIHTALDTCLKRIEKGTRPVLDHEGNADRAKMIFQSRIPYYFKAADVIVGGDSSPKSVSGVIYEEMCWSLED